MDEISQKLNALRKKYPEQEDQTLLNEWEKSAKVAVMTAKLVENDAVKLILEKYKIELADLNHILANNPSLFKDEDGRLLGQVIHAKKDFYIKFLKIFSSAQVQVDAMNANLDNKLNDEN